MAESEHAIIKDPMCNIDIIHHKEKDMYFWKINDLKIILASDKLSQRTLFGYILITFLLYQIVVESMLVWPAEQEESGDIYVAILNIMIVGFGIYFCYLSNGKGNGKYFAERFFSLSFVVSIRLIVFTLPLAFMVFAGAGAYLGYQYGADADISSLYTAIDYFFMGWMIFFYWRTGSHINSIADKPLLQ